MIGTLIGLILLVAFLGICWWAIQKLLPLLPIAEPFRTIIYVLLVLILAVIVLYVILTLLGMAGIHVNTFGLGRM